MRIENIHEVGVAGQSVLQSLPPWTVYNRTGGATVKGGIYQFDTHCQTAAESGANSEGVILPAVTVPDSTGADGGFGNIITPDSSMSTGAATDAGLLNTACFCVALQAVADNEKCKVLVVGIVDINIGEVTGGTAAPGTIGPWRRVTPTDAASTGTIVIGTGGTTKVVAVTLESATFAASGDDATVTCYFNGINGTFAR